MVYDVLNFIKKLTLIKIFNILKVNASFYLSVLLKKPVVWGMPYSYSIEPTCICNLTCPECPTGKGSVHREKKEISPDVYQSVINHASRYASYLMLYFQGEPFLNKNIFRMIRLANRKGIYTCLSSNGHFLDKQAAAETVLSGLDRIIISMDGTTDEIYRQYRRGGNLTTVLNGITNLVEAKRNLHSKTPYVILQFIVFKHNQHQIKDFLAMKRSTGVNKAELKTAQLYDFENGHPMMPDFDKYSRYRKQGNRYTVKSKPVRGCKRIWTTGVITSDHKLVSCCYDKTAEYVMGNSGSEDMHTLWNGTAFMYFRNKTLLNKSKINICRNCREN